jgi:ABC-type lipoprotein export system ATPase subunit
VKLFGAEINASLARRRLNAAVDSLTSGVRLSSPLVIPTVGAAQVIGGQLSLGTMLALNALAAGFLEPLVLLVATGLQVQLLSSYVARINDVLETPREQPGQDIHAAGTLSGHIQAERLSLRFGPVAPLVVQEVSVEIRPGQKVAIVGRSGSGKSTLAHLLLGLYAPVAARVLYDGMDLARLKARSVRRQIGIVTENAYLFGSTIRENIALSDPRLPLEAVERAARLACIHDDIAAMPMGYETPLADAGASQSGGQRQRIALARAIVHQPRILLLDEATSALDALTERQVHRNLDALACAANRYRSPPQYDRGRRRDPGDGRRSACGAGRPQRGPRLVGTCWPFGEQMRALGPISDDRKRCLDAIEGRLETPPQIFEGNALKTFSAHGAEAGCDALVRQLVGAGVEANVVELLLGVPEDDTSLGHTVDSARRHVQVLSKAKRPSLDLDDLAVHAGDRPHLLARDVARPCGVRSGVLTARDHPTCSHLPLEVPAMQRR